MCCKILNKLESREDQIENRIHDSYLKKATEYVANKCHNQVALAGFSRTSI